MSHQWIAKSLTTMAALMCGCTPINTPLTDWTHENHSSNSHSPAQWTLHTQENLLTGQQTHALCGTSQAAEAANARFCFRRERGQLVIYVVPRMRVRTAKCCVLTYVRVDSNRPVSARSAVLTPWARGYDPRFPGASFPIDGTNPRTGTIDPDGLFDQLKSGRILSARVPIEPAGFRDFTIHLDDFAPLLRQLWKNDGFGNPL